MAGLSCVPAIVPPPFGWSRGRGFAPKGGTPARPMRSQRTSVSSLSAISNTGLLRFMVLKKAIDAPTLLSFLNRLCEDAGREVLPTSARAVRRVISANP